MSTIDQFAELSASVVRHLPRDLKIVTTQLYVDDQGLLACVIRAALIKNQFLNKTIEKVRMFSIVRDSRLIEAKLKGRVSSGHHGDRRSFDEVDKAINSKNFPGGPPHSPDQAVVVTFRNSTSMVAIDEVLGSLNLRGGFATELIDWHMTDPNRIIIGDKIRSIVAAGELWEGRAAFLDGGHFARMRPVEWEGRSEFCGSLLCFHKQ